MLREALERRDLEVLRTLVRLRYVTTVELQTAFFPSDRVARRRLRHLEVLGLISTHSRGVPQELSYGAWRLTEAGLRTLAACFPEEPQPPGLGENLGRGSLLHLEHRGGLNRLYLQLLLGDRTLPREGIDRRVASAFATRLRDRASQFAWEPDGSVVLDFEDAGGKHQLLPDSVVTARHVPVRVFLELDRSSRGLSRLKNTFQRYAHFTRYFYAKRYTDLRTPVVLFLVPSEGRKESFVELATTHLSSVRWAVEVEAEGAQWLARTVLAPDQVRALNDAYDQTLAQTCAGRPDAPHNHRLAAALAELYSMAASWVRDGREQGWEPSRRDALALDNARSLLESLQGAPGGPDA
jgi:hypothetical protein